MISRNLYTRRMSRAELDIWLELSGNVSPPDRELAERFTQLEDSMFFLSSIGDEIVGGTAIFRDKTRLAVALIAAHHRSDLNEATQLQLLKSSLPFFRSVTIHHVDAAVSTSGAEVELPFPAGFVLNKRFKPMLQSLGFAEEESIVSYFIDISGNQTKEARILEWKSTDDHESVRDLFWRQNKTTGIDSSFVTLGWQMASAKNLLETLKDDKGITAAVGVDVIGDVAMIWPVIADFRLLDVDKLAQAICGRVQETRATTIAMPILGTGQKELAGIIADLCNGKPSAAEALLLRKQL
ncbi:MAG: hypothetical protein ACW974_04980 [Candidatus Thorarchaeota archaeon]